MNEEYTIHQVEKPDESAWKAIRGGISKYNTQPAGEAQHKSLCFLLRTPDQEIVGGLIGELYWNWFYINLLLVKEELRGRGYGHRLMELAEEETRQLGARHAYLDKFSFQASDFYQQHGYRVFGELNDVPPGCQRYFHTKQL